MTAMALMAGIRRATGMHGMGLSPGELSLAISLVGLDIVARLAPHAPNVTPIAASAVFAGMVLRSRALALAVPLAALLVSDLVVGFYDWRIMGVVYAALALPALLARWGRAWRPVVVLAPLVLSSSLLFFTTTNFAVWAFSGMYAHDLHGLVHCYAAALPFLQNTVIGDMFWATLLFGSWWSARVLFATAADAVCPRCVMRGLDPRIHPFAKKFFEDRWIAGSSPAMTADGALRAALTPSATTDRARPS
jgi:hypothetical protein